MKSFNECTIVINERGFYFQCPLGGVCKYVNECHATTEDKRCILEKARDEAKAFAIAQLRDRNKI